jgi:serine protease inhibitor
MAQDHAASKSFSSEYLKIYQYQNQFAFKFSDQLLKQEQESSSNKNIFISPQALPIRALGIKSQR